MINPFPCGIIVLRRCGVGGILRRKALGKASRGMRSGAKGMNEPNSFKQCLSSCGPPARVWASLVLRCEGRGRATEAQVVNRRNPPTQMIQTLERFCDINIDRNEDGCKPFQSQYPTTFSPGTRWKCWSLLTIVAPYARAIAAMASSMSPTGTPPARSRADTAPKIS